MKKYKWIFVFSLLVTYFCTTLINNTQVVLAQQSDPICISLNKSKDFYQFENGTNDYIERARSIFWSPDSKKIAVALERIDITKVIIDPEDWIQVWDVTTGSTIAKLKLDLYSQVKNVVWSNDSTKMAVVLRDGIRIWEGEQDWSPTILRPSRRSLFIDVWWSDDAAQLYTTDTVQPRVIEDVYRYGNVIRRWDVASGEMLEESPTFDQVFVTHNGDQKIIISSDHNELSVRDEDTNQVQWSKANVYLAGSVFNKNVQRLATITLEKDSTTLSVWDIPTNKNLLNITEKYVLAPYLNFAPNGNFVESTKGFPDATEIWSLETGQQITLPTIGEYIWKKTFWSPTQDCAISMGSKPPPRIWNIMLLWNFADPLGGHLLTQKETAYDDVKWSPDGKQIAVIEKTVAAKNPDNVVRPPIFSSKLVIWSADN